MSCCEDPAYAKDSAERLKAEKVMLEQEVNINGVKLQVKDMFPDPWNAKDFVAKLNLLNKSIGGKALLDTSPMSIMEDDDEVPA